MLLTVTAIYLQYILLILFGGWLHFYLLPQYLIELIQCFYNRSKVIFCFKLRRYDKKIQKPMVALTIDDSPTKHTLDILDILKQYDAKATFFIISSYVPGNEHVMDRIIEDGHEIANHTTADVSSWTMPDDIFEGELLKCENALEPWKIKKKKRELFKWFRPGKGLFTSSMLRTLSKYKYRLALANVYPSDANGIRKIQSNNPSLNAWYLRNRVREGCIIVIHDRAWTPLTLSYSLKYLTSQFHIETLSECAQFYESK